MVSKSQLQALLKKKKGAMCAQPPTTAVSEISVSSSSTPASSQFLLPKLERSSSNKTTLAAVKPAPTHVSHPPTTTTTSSNNGLSTLQLKMKDKLAGAQFRWINERLYTTPSESAVAMFGEKPEYFDIYHQGFRNQVKVWPMNPVDVILKDLLKMPVLGWPDSVKEIVVADMGCGEAKLHQVLSSSSSPPTTSTSEEENNIHKDKQKKKRKNTWKIHSFDLVAANDHVVACDIANVPLPAKSCDVVVFCLSLMGTNFLDFIKEANRILKPK